MSNPSNTWTGNVAAGSESNGFWFELNDEVRLPTALMPSSQGMVPRRMPLGLFRDNVAHSNRKHGFRTYPNGYLPPARTAFYNLRSYRNRQDGIFLHVTDNVIIDGGLVADNRLQIDLDRANNITINSTRVVGVSDSYANIVATQIGAYVHDDAVVGIQLHSYTPGTSYAGATVRNVDFSGFFKTRSNYTALIDLDPEKGRGSFDYWTSVGSITVSDVDDKPRLLFSFMNALKNGVNNAYITDIDSSMKPIGSTAVRYVETNTF
jgi:hypothetical protein